MKRIALAALMVLLPLALFAQSQQAAPERKMLQQLGLTDAQVAQVMDIQTRTRDALRQGAAQVRLLRAQIDKAMVASTVDMQTVNGLVDQLSQARAGMQKTFLAARVQLQQIMGPDNLRLYMRHLRWELAHGFQGGRGGPWARPWPRGGGIGCSLFQLEAVFSRGRTLFLLFAFPAFWYSLLMENVVPAPAAAALCLLAVQAVLVLVRTPASVRPSVPLLLSGFLLAMTLRLLPFVSAAFREGLLIALIWSAGAFLIRATNRRMFWPWAGVSLALCLTLMLARALGYESAVQYGALRSFGVALLAAMPIGMSFGIWRVRRSMPALATFLAGGLWLLIGGAETTSGFALVSRTPFDGTPELLLSFCTGWLVFQEGYPERTSWRGSLPSLTPQEGRAQAMYARLLATESALVWQERVTAAGFLALGAAHEFKNTLSHVRLAAKHGLAQGEPGRKDDCLRLVLECANTGQDSAVEVLQLISSGGAEAFCTMEAARDLSVPIRRAGAALRGRRDRHRDGIRRRSRFPCTPLRRGADHPESHPQLRGELSKAPGGRSPAHHRQRQDRGRVGDHRSA